MCGPFGTMFELEFGGQSNNLRRTLPGRKAENYAILPVHLPKLAENEETSYPNLEKTERQVQFARNTCVRNFCIPANCRFQGGQDHTRFERVP